jgi:hypothetical protein
VGLQPDAVDFDNPRENFRTIDRITEDVLSLAMEDLAEEFFKKVRPDGEGTTLKAEVDRLVKAGYPKNARGLTACPEVSNLVGRLKKMAPEKANLTLLSDNEKALFTRPQSLDSEITDEYDRSAIEMVVNLAASRGILNGTQVRPSFFVPKKFDES